MRSKFYSGWHFLHLALCHNRPSMLPLYTDRVQTLVADR